MSERWQVGLAVWLWMSACSGGSPLEAPSHGVNSPERRPIAPAPVAEEDDRDGACRAIVRRGENVLLTSANGEERLLDRSATWAKSFGEVWAIGEHAIVGVPESDGWTAHGPFAALALVHAREGVLWRGTAPASDYIRATGFRSLTREGYVVLNDSRVIDPSGAEHDPLEGFLPIVDSLDEDGFILVGRAGELAYWNVRADQLDRSVTAALGHPITEPVQLGGLAGRDASFVEEATRGELSFTRIGRGGVERAALSAELAGRLRALLPSTGEDFEAVALRTLDDAALLVVDHRPAAWVRAGATPHVFDAWSSLPSGRETQAAGGCFAGAPTAASSEAEVIAGLWRVHTASGELEMGLRFAIPAGLSLVILDPLEPGYAFPLPVCARDGRMAVMLAGPEGFAWFTEGDAGFEQASVWGEQVAFEPFAAPSAGPEPRVLGPFSTHYPTMTAHDCELRYEDGNLLMLDHALDLELPLAPDANAALIAR